MYKRQIIIDTIDAAYPVAGVDNDTQGFRDNFQIIKTGLATATSEITTLQSTTAKLTTSNDFNGTNIADANIQVQTSQYHSIGTVTAAQNISFLNGHYQAMTINLAVGTNSVAFNLPTADGSSGQFLKTNGSGTLSFGTVSTTGAFLAFEYTATAAQTTFTGSDDNSATLAYTAGVNNLFVTVNGVMLDGSDYTATNGTAVVLSAAANANDMIKILATNASSITTADLDGSEFVLDADGDTTLHADTDDQIDIQIAGADDFQRVEAGARAWDLRERLRGPL